MNTIPTPVKQFGPRPAAPAAVKRPAPPILSRPVTSVGGPALSNTSTVGKPQLPAKQFGAKPAPVSAAPTKPFLRPAGSFQKPVAASTMPARATASMGLPNRAGQVGPVGVKGIINNVTKR